MQSPTDVLVVLTEIDVGLSKDQYMIKRQTHRTGSAGRKDGKDRGRAEAVWLKPRIKPLSYISAVSRRNSSGDKGEQV